MIKKLFLTGLVASAIAAGPAQAQDQLRLADKQFELRNYEAAFSTYLKCGTDDDQVKARLAQVEIARCNDDKAIYWLEKITTPATRTATALAYGHALKRQGRYTEAKQAYISYQSTDRAVADHFIASCDEAIHLMSQDMVEVYPAAFNTKYTDFALTFYGDQPIFCSFDNNLSFINPVEKKTGNRTYSTDQSVLLEVNRAYNLRPALKANYSIGPISYAGEHCAYAENSIANASKHTIDDLDVASIYLAKTTRGGDFEDEYAFPHNGETFATTHPTLSADGQTLYFASNRPGGYGGYDIYVSRLEDGKWTTPANLGAAINTEGNEITPHITEAKLYFASDFHIGLGGYDLFEAAKSGDTWAPPINMGNGINSTSDDYYPATMSGVDRLYFTSNRIGGRGNDDIYVSEKLSIDPIAPPAYVLGEQQPSATSNPQAMAVAEKSVISIPVPAANVAREDIAVDAVAARSPIAHTTSTRKVEAATPVVLKAEFDLSDARRVWMGSALPPTASVYFVQLAALNRRSANLSSFEDLVTFGNIYKVYANNAVKVRLGYFNSEEEARSTLRQIKAQGYRDAFITYQPLDINNLELVYSSYDYGTTSTTSTTSTSSTDYNSSSYMVNRKTFKGTSNYKVRLASYEDPAHFNVGSVSDIGQIEQWTKGGWTIFILSGYRDLGEAEEAKRKAINKGFRDAEVVLDNDGILERLRKN